MYIQRERERERERERAREEVFFHRRRCDQLRGVSCGAPETLFMIYVHTHARTYIVQARIYKLYIVQAALHIVVT